MKHSQLRFALLASLGLVPIGCGGNTAGNAGSAGSAGQAEMEHPVTCSSPQEVPGSGLITCDEGFSHRPTTNITCGSSVSADGVDQTSLPRAEAGASVGCEGDASPCASLQYGYCRTLIPQTGFSMCASGCRSDADCGAGSLCVCSAESPNGWGTCERGTCKSDRDCGPGFACAVSSSWNAISSSYTNCGAPSFACQTASDTCTGDADCAGLGTCQAQPDGHHQCVGTPPCGRPFLVASQPRLAPIVQRGDWLVALRTT